MNYEYLTNSLCITKHITGTALIILPAGTTKKGSPKNRNRVSISNGFPNYPTQSWSIFLSKPSPIPNLP